jgi:hypothetical protein
MKKLIASFLLAFLLVLLFLPRLHAQTATTTAADANAAAGNAALNGQAPDEVMKKLSDLVHAGKYAEAQQLTTGLLLAYPDDQRLTKAKALLDKSLAAASAKAIPNADPSASDSIPTPATGTAATQLTGMDKVDYNALIVLARQAQQNTDLEQQKAALNQFMDQSTSFLRKHPDQILLWKLRVASAISLNDPIAGYEAGQKLLTAGAADSDDPGLQELMAELKNKGWLDKQGAESAQEYVWLRSLQPTLAYGGWSTGHFNVLMKTKLTVTISGLGGMKDAVGIRLENGSPKTCRVDGGAMGTLVIRPEDAASGTFTTTRTATLTDWHSYDVPCTVTLSVVDKNGKDVSNVTINNGH